MGLKEFKDEIETEVDNTVSSDMNIIVTETKFVPAIDDTSIMNPNYETKEQKCKLIETCVLYIDMRSSTDISSSHRQSTLAKLYTTFVRTMAKCAEYYGGHVRGIIGDRLMVVFDSDQCFRKSIDTAVLMNSAAKYVVNKKFDKNDVQAGIGIDYGKMLVAKAGIVKQGVDNLYNKSLVWLGRPANVASKLTDIANKPRIIDKTIVKEGLYFPLTKKWVWQSCDIKNFVDKLEVKNFTPVLEHPEEYFAAKHTTNETTTTTPPRILFTKAYYDGLTRECADDESIKKGWWTKRHSLRVAGYSGAIYGGDVFYTIFKE